MIFRWRPSARADLRRIPKDEALSILHALARYGASRSGDVARLMEKEFGRLLRLRLGDYRVFFRPESDGSILIVRVLHRSEAYR